MCYCGLLANIAWILSNNLSKNPLSYSLSYFFFLSGCSVEYSSSYLSSWFFHANTPTGNVQVGTKNNKAGWGWFERYITANVIIIPETYPITHVLKYGVFN